MTERQIRFLGLRHTGFAEDLDNFAHEDVSATGNLHQRFKLEKLLIDPTEPAASYNEAGEAAPRADSSALRGFGDIWASAQDVSYWDIGLAGGRIDPQTGTSGDGLCALAAAGRPHRARRGGLAVLQAPAA